MKPSSNSSHKKDDRKPADKPNGVSQNTQRVDEKLTLGNDELVCVVEDYFAIDKVVGWRGEGRAREYRIRWKGQTPATDDWLKPSDLCKETLMEAHALVREDKRRQERLEKGIQEKASGVKPQQIVAATVTKKKVSPKPETSNKNSIVKSSQTNHPSVKPSQTNHHGVKQSQTKCPSVKPSKTNHPSVKPSKTNTVKPSHAKSLMVNKPSPPEVQDLTLDESDSGDGWSVVSNRPPEEIHKVVAKRKAPSKESCIDLTKQGANQNDKLLTLSASVNRRVDKEPLKKKRRRKRSKQKIDPVIDPEEWKRRELARGNDVGVVDFQPVERIDVTDSSAKKRVSEARINGIPIVLTGYLGWPQFATRWIKGSSEDDKVDFSKGVKLDIEKMVDDIGKEEVPIVEKNYDESNPAGNVMKASVFLNNFWPKEGENESTKKKLYLQQWQFSSSERASKILCGPDKCGPPPPSAFYEDLLPFWLSEGGNPYQYLFMGDAGTMSKLHKDPGGLEILIAPIIGQKECILCHRDDGPDYLYNLQSKLDTIDLIRFPMTAFARVWKTVVKPGEILVMPHDTYHQCRNLTPCLSYHRLHLDIVNLRGFIKSMYAGDAKELEHTEVIWNTSHGLMARVDEYIKQYRMSDRKIVEDQEVEGSIAETVDLLRHLTPACLGIVRYLEAQEGNHRTGISYSDGDWKKLATDMGQTLHEYRHRDTEKVSRYRPPTLAMIDSDSEDSSDEQMKSQYSGKWRLNSELEALKASMENLPGFKPDEEDLVISDFVSLKVGDEVHVRLNNRLAQGIVEKVSHNKKGVFVRYEDLPACFDEYHPRGKVHGRTETISHLVSTVLRPALDMSENVPQVQCIPSCGPAEPQQGIIVSSKTGTFYLVRITLDSSIIIRRMLSRDSIVRKINAS